MLPSRLGRYEVLGRLASGGMAEILLARLSGPAGFQRAVVIKRVLRSHAANASFVRMFLHEARIVSALRHPNIVHVQELGEADGEAFLVMEYIDGENASSLLKRSIAAREPLDPRLAAHIVAETCGGLHVAHELKDAEGKPQHLVHRDVSPQNVLVSYDGHVKLVDFGVALLARQPHLTEPGELKGKLAYMSPEQCKARPLDRRSDLFSLGAVLYELSTGRQLFQRPSAARCIDAICREPVVPPSRVLSTPYPASLEAVVMRALAKAPEARYPSAAEMRLALLEVVRELPRPVETLADGMRRLFPDRIAEKEELLRKVREGEELFAVPAGETDEDVVVPAAPEETVVEPAPPFAPRRTRSAGVVAAGVAIAALTATVATIARERSKAPSPVSIPATAPVASPAPVVPEPRDANHDVLVRVESHPAGARVVLRGHTQGTTPVELRLARSSEAIGIELTKEGHEKTLQRIVPDADQKVVVALTPLAPSGKGPPRAKRPPPEPSAASKFRRFD